MNTIAPSNIDQETYFKDSDGGYCSVRYDPYPENPFTLYDSLGTYYTWENRHISPSENPYQTALDFTEAALGGDKAQSCKTMQDVLDALDQAGYVAAGIYRHEHGDVSYALGSSNPYGDYWDSGAVGFAFVSPGKLASEGITKEQALDCMSSEMGDYSCWANGDVFLVERFDEQGEPVEVETFYGLNSFVAEYPDVEPISLGEASDLPSYIHREALNQELDNSWSFKYSLEWRHSAFIKEPMAIVSDELGDSWRIVDIQTSQVSFGTFDTPQEALAIIKEHQGMSEEERKGFIPPNHMLERPLDDLKREATEKATEINAERLAHGHERKPPGLDR